MLLGIDSYDPLDHVCAVLNSIRPECSRGKDLERLAMEKCSSWVFGLFIEIVSQELKTVLEILLDVLRPALQAQRDVRPHRTGRQPFHDCFRSRDEQDGLPRSSHTAQYRRTSAGDLAGRLEAVEGQRIQSGKYHHVRRGVEQMEQAAESLCPMPILSQKNEAAAT